ncbi:MULTISPECIES: type II toxin-antitoxin system VapC family toxin [unclassified Polaribacter]|uniref:type II toxin-antitoxin system VapC family toxin n=1 Tax=unclassified Polaribacter TaxID=196858 RepID=UPI0011BFAB11|nr:MULTISPECIES: PIN domain-containing protein [unclassified Polaribacter]TXD52541.1 PIN domain-containing protein [Polaribacter sp. IC063]TXD60527.1 PIN domain-containing protein [Polaribacter sp. IC066]
MKKRIFLDTNVMLDFLGERIPFYDSIARVLSFLESNKFTIIVSPISYATVSYFLSKSEGNRIAVEKLRKFKVISDVCIIDEQTIEKGLNSDFSDFEDALQFYNAVESNCDIILTRNAKDFKKATLPVMSPDEFLNSL